MDGSRFDTLTRVFGISRRSTVRALLGGALGAALSGGGGNAAAACKVVLGIGSDWGY